jgi:hypothetical protein
MVMTSERYPGERTLGAPYGDQPCGCRYDEREFGGQWFVHATCANHRAEMPQAPVREEPWDGVIVAGLGVPQPARRPLLTATVRAAVDLIVAKERARPPAPRPGQTWRRTDGEEGTVYDVEEDRYRGRTTYRLRMISRLRVEAHRDHDDAGLPGWTFVRGPLQPETPAEAWDRVAALVLADRPGGVTEDVWRAVCADVREQMSRDGKLDADRFRLWVGHVRRAFEIAERART